MNLLEDALANLSLNHGQIKRLETNHHELSLDESLKASIYNGTDLDKRLFYIISQWVESQTSSQTQGEREIIAQLVPELADDLKAWSSPVLIEYGSGNGLKTEIILDEFEKKKIPCSYVAIDINFEVLKDYLNRLEKRYSQVKCIGLCGSFEDATSEIETLPGNKFIFSLASTLNMEKERYISFLQRLTKISKRIMISQQTPAAGGNLQKSYSTKEYIDFIWRGLQYANQLIGCQEFNDDDWQIDHWFSTEGQEDWCHKFEIIPRNSFEKKTFRTFASIKYTHSAFKEIAVQAGLKVTKADEHNDTGMVAYQLEPEAIICRLVFCRHEEAISNLKLSDGLDIRKMSVQESKKLNEKLQTNTIDGDRIGLGDFWPDGLTQYGKIQATTRSLNLLENVYEVISSSSLRAMQTAFCMDGNFEKVGSRYDKNNQMLIRYDGRIREATNWPQDQAAIIKEEGCRKYASYIKVQGGNGHDKPSGTILGVETVDLTNTMPFGKYEDVTTISTMLESLKRPRKIEEIEEEVAQFISDLLRRALEIASEHKASGRKGNPHIVIVTHGGILNFIMNDWNCKFKESSDGMCLEWCESTNLENGDAVVCEFSNSSNRLREIPGDTYYKRIFGSHYRNLTEEKANLAESHNAEGSICNQRQEHLNFIERTADDVAATPTEALEVVWSGILRGKPRE